MSLRIHFTNRCSRKNDRTPQIKTSLKDLGGVDKIIQEVLELIGLPLSHPEVYQYIGTDTPRGVLLHGPPGCGKTVLANAIANEMGVPFISISAPSIVSGMSGESEKKLREVFEEAKPSHLVFSFWMKLMQLHQKRQRSA